MYLSDRLVTDKGRGVGLHGPRCFSSLCGLRGVVGVFASLAPDSRSSFVRLLVVIALRVHGATHTLQVHFLGINCTVLNLNYFMEMQYSVKLYVYILIIIVVETVRIMEFIMFVNSIHCCGQCYY